MAHIVPEAVGEGPTALVRDGDLIRVDIPSRMLDVLFDDDELTKRRENWQLFP